MKNTMHKYNSSFYKYINSGATQSAEIILSIINKHLSIHSVVDFGCGQGAWLASWISQGATRVVGIDGPYVDRGSLLIDVSSFRHHDLTERIDLKEKFNLVQSLEVAEHLPESSARRFIQSLVRHGDIVLFSAAVPGQGGENHVNEQSYEYWRELFSENDYVSVDAIRPYISMNKKVKPWYRYNSLLYVNRAVVDTLPDELKKRIVADDEHIPDLSPFSYKIRKNILRLLPVNFYTVIATLKKYLFVIAKQSS